MKKVKLGEILSLKKGKKATVLAEQTTLSQRYIQIDDLRNNNNLKFTESLNMTEALPDDILIAWDGANAGTVGYGLSGAVGSTITVLKKNERYKEKLYQITWESFWKVNRSIYEIIQQVQLFLI
ncbi:type I restriction-modification enzyme 1, S subunit [Streptococcus pneumoniae GA17227]|nr:type I restriction-modification enzyme 1, S subunit [Streptococcus pneumoniae GA17227]